MWLDEAEEIFKGYLPYYLLVFLPIFIMISPINPVNAANEFPVYRMQHFDLHGVSHGCRSAGVNLEARSLTGWSTSRHCIITKLQELTIDHFRNIRAKAGALVIVLPQNLTILNDEEKENLMLLENAMLAQEVSIPVYFSNWSLELQEILLDLSNNIDSNDLSKSAVDALVNSVAANGYQVVITGNSANVQNNIKVASIQGHLLGTSSTNGKIPTIAVVAHYDSFGVAPELSFGADSNASGIVILLELVRLFSSLYSDAKTQGAYNIIFLLSGAGKMNYHGSKKWLEEQLDSVEGSLIQDASYVICLDSLASSDSIYMHVSKPPKEGSQPSLFFKELKASASKYESMTVEGVHKKINLADDILAWEHERYSIRRLPAFTLSALKSHKDNKRGTILDTYEHIDIKRLVRNAQVIAEALGKKVYNVTNGDGFGALVDVNENYIQAWLTYLTKQPRAAQLMSNKDNHLVKFLKDNFNKYLRDVKITHSIPDKRDPDFQFYDATGGTMNIYNVKPAVFDLVLTVAIVLYLCLAYIFIFYFPKFYIMACTLTANKKIKQ